MPKMVCLAGGGRAKCGPENGAEMENKREKGASGLSMPKVDMRATEERSNSVI